MSSRSRDDDRHYDNPFNEYSPQNAINIINFEHNDIQYSLKTFLKGNIFNLLRHLENNKREWENCDDWSIYTGNYGIAYMFYFIGKQFNEQSYIKRAVELMEKKSERKINKRKITFLTGEAGRLALGAVIYDSLQEKAKSLNLINKLNSLYDDTETEFYDELLYGRAGYLYALLFVNKNISTAPIKEELIKKVINCILSSGRSYSASRSYPSPLMYSWHDKEYLGGAHGLAGILYILLQAREYLTENQLKENIKTSIEYLHSLKFPSGNFPSSVGNKSDKLIQWCHGAPSMTMLFCLAYDIFGDQKYLDTAKECGEVVWTRGLLKKGCGICHGVSGNAYTFLTLYQKTKNVEHLYRACKFAEWCFDYQKKQNRIPDRPFSLFEGLAGIIYFLVDLTEPEKAKFPGYTL